MKIGTEKWGCYYDYLAMVFLDLKTGLQEFGAVSYRDLECCMLSFNVECGKPEC